MLPCLVFLDIVTVLSGASVLGPNSSPPSLDLSAISSIRTLCRVSLSFSLIPSFGLKTPRKSGSSSGVSGSRWAPTMVIFCCDLGQKYGVRTCRAVRGQQKPTPRQTGGRVSSGTGVWRTELGYHSTTVRAGSK